MGRIADSHGKGCGFSRERGRQVKEEGRTLHSRLGRRSLPEAARQDGNVAHPCRVDILPQTTVTYDTQGSLGQQHVFL